MWLLLFICTSTVVGGVPVHPTQEANSHAPDNVTVTHMLDVPKPATAQVLKVGVVSLNDTQNAPVGVISLNDTHNVKSPAAGAVASMPASAETLQDLQKESIVQEGDILIQDDRNAVQSLWADATVPFTISHDLADQEFNIFSAFKMISDFTCIRFKRRTTEFSYLQFKSGRGCASFVGCKGGAQTLHYSRSCSVGNLCHEIMHALGLNHEHTRQDRDQYISVQWPSIVPGRKKEFKVKRGNTLNLPYDVNSIMHYGQYFFSRDGSPTLLSKQSGVHMGQRTQLSPLDIQKVNRLYHCEERMRDRG